MTPAAHAGARTRRRHARAGNARRVALALLWVLPLLYAFWTAFHPSEFSTHLSWSAPWTLDNFVKAWHAAPFARYFLNTVVL